MSLSGLLLVLSQLVFFYTTGPDSQVYRHPKRAVLPPSLINQESIPQTSLQLNLREEFPRGSPLFNLYQIDKN